MVTERPDLAILAVHGPSSIEMASALLDQTKGKTVAGLKNFRGAELGDWFVARTGYTGEKGVEFIVPAEDAVKLWEQLLAAEVKPIGLGASIRSVILELWGGFLGPSWRQDEPQDVSKFSPRCDPTRILGHLDTRGVAQDLQTSPGDPNFKDFHSFSNRCCIKFKIRISFHFRLSIVRFSI